MCGVWEEKAALVGRVQGEMEVPRSGAPPHGGLSVETIIGIVARAATVIGKMTAAQMCCCQM